MMKKTLLAMALSALSLTAFAASDTPDILAALSDDSAQQIALMTDEQLIETKGSGLLPAGNNYNSYYYVWRNYGSQNDYRSYMYNFGSTEYGGRAEASSLGTGYRFGNVFYATTKGLNAPISSYTTMEENTKYAINLGGTWYLVNNFARNTNSWGRPAGSSNYW